MERRLFEERLEEAGRRAVEFACRYVRQALPDAAIQRIWACGIDGSRCSCRRDDPSTYASCGRAEPACASLPPCDQAQP